MARVPINPTDNIQAINDRIASTRFGDKIILETGMYTIDSTLHFIGRRCYIGHNVILQCSPDFKGAMVEITTPDLTKFERFIAKITIIYKIIKFICNLLHIPFCIETTIEGITFRGNGECTGIRMHNPS